MDNKELLKNDCNLKPDLETLHQRLYDYEKRIDTLEHLTKDYEDEINYLIKNKDSTLKEQQVLEEELSLLRKKLKQLEFSNSKNEEKKAQMEESALKLELVDGNLTEEIADLKEQILDLNDRLGQSLENLNESQALCKRQAIEVTLLQDTISEIKENLEQYKAISDRKTKELSEANTVISNLRDDNLCLQSELDTISKNPLDAQSRGNSLFAEVDDRRVKLQQNFNSMKTQYLQMKKERATHMRQIAVLQGDVAVLIARREEEVTAGIRDEEGIIESLNQQIKSLNNLIESYRRELDGLNQQRTVESSMLQDHRFFSKMLNEKSLEIEDLKKHLESKAMSNVTLTYDLVHLRRQIRQQELEILNFKNKVRELELKTEEMSLISIPAETANPDVEAPMEDREPSKSIIRGEKQEETTNFERQEENKEKKTVKFSEETTNRLPEGFKGRRGVILKPAISLNIKTSK